MKFSTLKNAIMLCRQARVSIFTWGQRGIGKSSAVSEVCLDNQLGVINMRLSQMEASDLRGLPDRKDGRTIYLPPADMPIGDLTWEEASKMVKEEKDERKRNELAESIQPRIENGILFLDELNRAQDDVLQAAFELVLDRKIGQYVLPSGWSIVCAGNFNEGDYVTNGFTDSAFLDRFCHVILSDGETTFEEWIRYMIETHGEKASEIIEFTSQNIQHLDGKVEGDLGFTIQPSRRSWDAVTRVMNYANAYDEEVVTEVVAGLVGREIGLSFRRYSCPVKPKEVIEKGVKEMEPKLRQLSRNQLVGLMWGLISFTKNHINEESYSELCLDFAEYLAKHSGENDLVTAFLHALVTSDNDQLARVQKAIITNPKVAKLINNVAKKHGKKNTFLERLNNRPELHELVSKVSWGIDEE